MNCAGRGDKTEDIKRLRPLLQHARFIYRYGTVRYGTVRYDTVRYSRLRYGTVRYRRLRYGTVRYSRLRYCMIPAPKLIQPRAGSGFRIRIHVKN
jgi:hypothetical protein